MAYVVGVIKYHDRVSRYFFIAPKLALNPSQVKMSNNRIEVLSALLIVKEQMRLSGIRKVTIKEYDYNNQNKSCNLYTNTRYRHIN